MIRTRDLIQSLNKNKINFFTGVPDSVLKSLTPYFEKIHKNHKTAVNEGNKIVVSEPKYSKIISIK